MPLARDPQRTILGGGLTRAVEASICQATASLEAARFAANASDPPALLAAAEANQPQVIVVTASWLPDTGLDLLAQLREVAAEPSVILLGRPLTALATVQALQLGLRGVLADDAEPGVIAKALAAVLAGEFWFSHDAAARVLALLAQAHDAQSQQTWRNLPALTGREHAVLVELLAGRSNREISDKLAISEQTVKVHLQHVFLKLGVHRRTDLLAAHSIQRSDT